MPIGSAFETENFTEINLVENINISLNIGHFKVDIEFYICTITFHLILEPKKNTGSISLFRL